MYLCSWLELRCDHCWETNWVSQGDVNDCSGCDIGPSIACWSCKKIFQLDGDMEDDIEFPDRLDWEYAEQGLETPT